MTTDPASGIPADRRRLVEVDRAEALRLLASVSYGRLVFTLGALPAVRPVNHIVDAGEIIVRTRFTAKVTSALRVLDGAVVAYEADMLDPVRRLGWSVVATGLAELVTDRRRVTRYEALLRPWVDMPMDTIISIQPRIIDGFRLVEAT